MKSTRGSAVKIPKEPSYYHPIAFKKGFNETIEPREIYPDENGLITIEIEELERFELRLAPENTSPCRFTGCLVVGNIKKALPIGSTLDAVRGVFSWQPGPGFIRDYRLVFIEETADGYITRKNILITITPISSARKD